MEFRRVTIEDARLLFEWRNDPETRRMSRDTSELTWDNHLAWLSRRLEQDDHGLYIAALDGSPVGTVRIDKDEISYTVAPEHRCKGIGEAMLIAAKNLFGPKIAEMKRNNIASAKVAERAGHIVRFID
ncbi:GNAT family N-acetyltransferase [Sinorhizobium saheli]|uniref:N-acetyltransferase domain-containing protein n=1 Tax=Sinorhizobium saheli TaxID=36856 RepID=A0A178YSF4_SINSA|nr:GNAT family N-acetyltransferase [Sinorhizobium saheli]MQW87734.1 GNAT family N-acetyltransferase [Sinorhizobium saheli]OAP50449.1 hypothetical protein ATB98_15225 [Sinorhizobium saheli]